MCLATVYKESDDSVIFKNVSRIDVDGNKLVLRDIMGDERVVEGRILMVDLANSIVKLRCEKTEGRLKGYCNGKIKKKIYGEVEIEIKLKNDKREVFFSSERKRNG